MYDEDEEFEDDDVSDEAFSRGRTGTGGPDGMAGRAGGVSTRTSRHTFSDMDGDDSGFGGGDGEEMYDDSQYDSDDDSIYGDVGDDDDVFLWSDGYDDDHGDFSVEGDDVGGGRRGRGFPPSRTGGRGAGGGRRGPRGGRAGRSKPPPARMEVLKARLFDAQTGLKTKMSSVSHKGAKVIRELKVRRRWGGGGAAADNRYRLWP